MINEQFIFKMFQTNTSKGYLIQVPLIFNNYQILKNIDSGSFSAVVQVKDIKTEKKYAAKIISLKDMKIKRAMRRINQEIEFLQRFNHQNIIKLEQVLKITNEYEEKFLILIEEFCSKGNLYDNIKRHQFRNENEKRKISHGIIEAIAYLHKRGIAHCDIKPQNILLDENNNPKLCDFNLSIDTKGEYVNDIGGTPIYKPPELYENYYYGNRMKTDIWSLGVTLFFMFENRLPFKRFADVKEGHIFLSVKNFKLNQFILKCLQINPKCRIDAKILKNDEYLNNTEENTNQKEQKEQNRANQKEEESTKKTEDEIQEMKIIRQLEKKYHKIEEDKINKYIKHLPVRKYSRRGRQNRSNKNKTKNMTRERNNKEYFNNENEYFIQKIVY